jgi:DNA polymerase III alpha subunit
VHDTIETTEIGKQFAEKYPVIRVAARIEGHTTHAGVHAAGILVCNRPVTDYVGVNGKDNSAMIDYREAELLNLLKIDALGLRTLTVLQETAEMAGFDYHDFYKIPLDDEAALELFRNDRLLGVFQFDAGAIKSLCRQIKVQNFDDICAITSLGRPGPIEGGGTRSYVERHNGYEEVTYISSHPKIIEITKPTLGVIVYQEQLMHICRAVGMDWKDVSMFRKVVAKRKGKELLGTYEDTFKRCAKDAGLPDTEANEVWEQMATFGKYGFNKSHAVSYGMVSYMCAWAKAHYPLQFAVANLNNMKSKDSAVRLLRDFVRHEGFEYVPVDPDMSDVNWSVHEGKLLGGLTNIHGLGESKAKKIIENRRAGKVDTPSIIRMLINARTDFDILFPCQHFWSEYYESGNVVTIDQILEAGEYTFIGKINKKKIKDLNTDEQVEKRGARFEKDSLALNIYVEDDTDEIMCRVPRNKFERYAREIIARDDAQAPYEKNWYMFTGKIINASMLFVLLDKITYLGERH